jgi:hypothetical protein
VGEKEGENMNEVDAEQGEELIILLRKIPNPSPLDYWVHSRANAMTLANEAADWIERQLKET